MSEQALYGRGAKGALMLKSIPVRSVGERPHKVCWGRGVLAEIPFFITFVFIIFPAAAVAAALLYSRRSDWRAGRAEAGERRK